MYELQLFNPPSGRYVPNVTGQNIEPLRDLGRLASEGDGFRIVSQDREKPLPLKPRIPYGCSGKPRKYKPATMIEPANAELLAHRAADWYTKREIAGETGIPVYLWPDSTFTCELMRLLCPTARPDVYRVVYLDPETAFGEITEDHDYAYAA